MEKMREETCRLQHGRTVDGLGEGEKKGYNIEEMKKAWKGEREKARRVTTWRRCEDKHAMWRRCGTP